MLIWHIPVCIYKRFTNSFFLEARWNRYQSLLSGLRVRGLRTPGYY